MSAAFQKLMASKSDESLQEYLTNRTTFLPQAVEAAIAEMQKRGRTFSDQELADVKQEFQERKKRSEEFQQQGGNVEQPPGSFWPLSRWRKNVVKDEHAPLYYSEWAVHGFTIAFNTFFGAVLIAINFSQTEARKAVWKVLTYGAVFTGLQIWLILKTPLRELNLLPLVCNSFGSCGLQYLFWNRYIGKDAKYRKKPIWTALIVAVMACIVLLTIIFGVQLL